ncbi:hypothetical protein PIIN_11830 [Serendipita indica DSM 11827]|uniref:Uncharacterized protein n=1 Tax=Serendipita indica (strain DSM 11827) TaxID=1109443 RepID=G4T7C5_SERID|nr:hypothetical protein PIIN_11830 [Serendipita indica DSM 11827]
MEAGDARIGCHNPRNTIQSLLSPSCQIEGHQAHTFTELRIQPPLLGGPESGWFLPKEAVETKTTWVNHDAVPTIDQNVYSPRMVLVHSSARFVMISRRARSPCLSRVRAGGSTVQRARRLALIVPIGPIYLLLALESSWKVLVDGHGCQYGPSRSRAE